MAHRSTLPILGLIIMLLLTCVGVPPTAAGGPPVGRFTQVTGEVDTLPDAQLPAQNVKVADGVHNGDLVRTKTQSRAEITFLDESLLRITPGSRVTIEGYAFDAAGRREATISVSVGMIFTEIKRLLKPGPSQITVQTETTIIGIRGTKTYTLCYPGFTDVFNEAGSITARHRNPAIAGEVKAGTMEWFRVAADQPPTPPQPFTRDQLQYLNHLMQIGVTGNPGASSGPALLQHRVLMVQPGVQRGLGLPGGGAIPTIPPVVTKPPAPSPAPAATPTTTPPAGPH